MCYAEDIVASVIRGTIDDVNRANNKLLENLEVFTGEIESQISNVTDEITGITKQITEILGSISGAMNFSNIMLNVFGCDLSPNVAASDFFTLDGGSGGQTHAQLPSTESITQGANSDITKVPEPEETKVYATPPKGQSNVVYNPAPETRVDPTS